MCSHTALSHRTLTLYSHRAPILCARTVLLALSDCTLALCVLTLHSHTVPLHCVLSSAPILRALPYCSSRNRVLSRRPHTVCSQHCTLDIVLSHCVPSRCTHTVCSRHCTLIVPSRCTPTLCALTAHPAAETIAWPNAQRGGAAAPAEFSAHAWLDQLHFPTFRCPDLSALGGSVACHHRVSQLMSCRGADRGGQAAD